jgi:hypothetical protein
MTIITTEEFATSLEHERSYTAMANEKMLAAARGIIDATLEHAGLDGEAIAKARAELVVRAEQQAAPVYTGPEPDQIVELDVGSKLGIFHDADPIKAAMASLGLDAKLVAMNAFSDGIVKFAFADSAKKISYATLEVTNGTIQWLKDVAEVVDLCKQSDRKYVLTAKAKNGQRIHIVLEEVTQ